MALLGDFNPGSQVTARCTAGFLLQDITGFGIVYDLDLGVAHGRFDFDLGQAGHNFDLGVALCLVGRDQFVGGDCGHGHRGGKDQGGGQEKSLHFSFLC